MNPATIADLLLHSSLPPAEIARQTGTPIAVVAGFHDELTGVPNGHRAGYAGTEYDRGRGMADAWMWDRLTGTA